MSLSTDAERVGPCNMDHSTVEQLLICSLQDEKLSRSEKCMLHSGRLPFVFPLPETAADCLRSKASASALEHKPCWKGV